MAKESAAFVVQAERMKNRSGKRRAKGYLEERAGLGMLVPPHDREEV